MINRVWLGDKSPYDDAYVYTTAYIDALGLLPSPIGKRIINLIDYTLNYYSNMSLVNENLQIYSNLFAYGSISITNGNLIVHSGSILIDDVLTIDYF